MPPPLQSDPRADLDHDGIKDTEDPCIAPEVDLLIDSDDDQVPSSADLESPAITTRRGDFVRRLSSSRSGFDSP